MPDGLRERTTALLEREREVDRLGRSIESAAEGRGSLVYLEGPAGIGKTRLLAAAAERAQQRALKVLSARGAPLEHEFAFGVVRRLFEAELAGDGNARARVSSGHAALGAAAIGIESGVSPSADEGIAASLHGLYWLTSNLADESPVTVLVDDLHWADHASLRFLAYLAARVEGLPVALVLAARTGEPSHERPLLEELVAMTPKGPLRPEPLSVAATGRLAAKRLGASVGDEFARACREVTTGNPFLVHELLGAFSADGADPATLGAASVRNLGPNTVSRSLMLRLARMPEAAGKVTAALAVLGEDVALEHAGMVAEVAPAEAAAVVDVLAQAEILAAERPLNFIHPIVRAAVYDDLGPGERATHHGRAADVLMAASAPAGQIAIHVLNAEPAGDPERVALLRRAAAEAVDSGAPEVAVGCLRRAIDERAAPRPEAELLYELGRAEYFAGDADAAVAHLREAIPLLRNPADRMVAWMVLSRTTMSYVGVPEAVIVLEEALADLPDLDREARLRLEVERNALGMTHADLFERTVTEVDRLPDVPGETLAERLVLCNLAFRIGMRGTEMARTVELCERAFADERLAASEGTASNTVDQALYVWWFADAVPQVSEQIEIALEQARVRGSAWDVASAWTMRGGVRLVAGDLAGCETDARLALAVPGFPPFASITYAFLAWALIERGELAAAETALEAGGCGPELPPVYHMELLFYVRALLRSAQGRFAEALVEFEDYGRRCERVGAHNPGIPWRAQAALTCARLGDSTRAAELADEHLRRARAWGADSVVGIALRTVGAVANGEEAVGSLRESVAILERSPARLEHAKALVELGAGLRRAGHPRDAREPLRDGIDLARSCGARPLAQRAHDELVRTGARPQRLMFSGVEALTPSERRVADMAAEGMSNREIAHALFVTPKTIENHLTRVYSKLDVHSRDELPGALSLPAGIG